MPEIFVCNASDLGEGNVKVVAVDDREIGVIRHKGQCYAYLNRCPHQGGPACEGVRMPKVEAVLNEERQFFGHRFSDTEDHIVCPWHGYEFNLDTGNCIGDAALRLKRYDVVERQDSLYVVL
ncbi:Rieske (2Fe-2S) protein [Ancylobacter polymorphus]|uniref:Nitrite reductase/ring-hydroxylating ferredoxin subunit n=1 Tax=Ancylobacter polymorphus TaxID=223390 RepID=A0ABU0BGL1_9HYPH|nr:Rieske (2Fe-2S) protein [Ancylobacter polymorphus]MDQ0304965.1 nitrite reductase/ring-hydroxylating ferredoxin subunit [Ancylobacter polymorphus]